MPKANDPALGINSWLEDELYEQYRFDRGSLDQGWTELFHEAGHNGAAAEMPEPQGPPLKPPPRPDVPEPQQPPPPIEPEPRREPPTKEPPRKEPPAP
ncbi:MAG: hypothetical protein ACRD45_02615, partial [Bryobacteraceae bacterium]